MPNNSLGILEGPNMTCANITGTDIDQYRRVKRATTTSAGSVPNVALAGIADPGLGFAQQPLITSGRAGIVRLENATGTQIGVASEAIAAGDTVYTAAAGKVSKTAAGALHLGTALTDASGDGVAFSFCVTGGQLPVAA